MASGGPLAFLFLTSGILASYLFYGYVQEGIYERQPDGTKFKFTTFLLVVQCIANAAFAGLLVLLSKFIPALDSVFESHRHHHHHHHHHHHRDGAKEEAGAGESKGKAKLEDAPRVEAAPAPLRSIWDRESQTTLFLISASYIMAMWSSNESLRYVSYPLQALAKSCKMIPVMLGQLIVGGKKHPFYKYVCVTAMVIGVAYFQILGSKESSGGHGGGGGGGHGAAAAASATPMPIVSSSSTATSAFASVAGGLNLADLVSPGVYGMGLLFLSLVCDGFTGPRQEGLLETHHMSPILLMGVVNFYAILLTGAVLLVRQEALTALTYVLEHPAILDDLLFFAISSAVGQVFIFATVAHFDSLLLTTVTTIRKFLTIVVSVFGHGHGLSVAQWLCVLLVFGAIVFDTFIAKRLFPHAAKKHGGAKASDDASTAITGPLATGPASAETTSAGTTAASASASASTAASVSPVPAVASERPESPSPTPSLGTGKANKNATSKSPTLSPAPHSPADQEVRRRVGH